MIDKEALRKAIHDEYNIHRDRIGFYGNEERKGILKGLDYARSLVARQPEVPNCIDIDLGVKRLIRKCAATLIASRTFLSDNKISDYRLSLDLGVMYSLALGCFDVSVTLSDDCILFHHKQELIANCSFDTQELKFVNKR